MGLLVVFIFIVRFVKNLVWASSQRSILSVEIEHESAKVCQTQTSTSLSMNYLMRVLFGKYLQRLVSTLFMNLRRREENF